MSVEALLFNTRRRFDNKIDNNNQFYTVFDMSSQSKIDFVEK